MSVRTTLTLDDDVASSLRREARRRGSSVRVIVNEALRVGLQAATEVVPFVVEPQPMGLRDGLDLDDIEGLLDLIDGPQRR